MEHSEIICWVDKLNKCYAECYVDLDHKDCQEIAEILYYLMKEVDGLKGFQGRYEMEIPRIIEALTLLSRIKYELQKFKEQKPNDVRLL